MKTAFVLMVLVASGQLSFTQQGPAQQQHAPPGASTAPASVAVAQAEHLTLWGIIVGAPAPAWRGPIISATLPGRISRAKWLNPEPENQGRCVIETFCSLWGGSWTQPQDKCRKQAITRFDLELISSAIPATGFDLDASVRVRAPRQELLRANGLDAQRHSYPEMWDRER